MIFFSFWQSHILNTCISKTREDFHPLNMQRGTICEIMQKSFISVQGILAAIFPKIVSHSSVSTWVTWTHKVVAGILRHAARLLEQRQNNGTIKT